MGPSRAYGTGEGASLYTELDLDRGVGMKFHPLCGLELRCLAYDWQSRQFSCTFHFGGWCMDGKRVAYDRISGGMSWGAGEPYPPHWKFHPLSGKKLERRRTMSEHVTYTSEQIDAGQFGAKFHPVTGFELERLHYHRERRVFYSMSGCTTNTYWPRIGDGTDRCTGNLYHDHWQFDPFTGQPLSGALVRGLWEQD